MLAARNYDILCYHLKVVYKNLNNPVQQKLDHFLQEVEKDLLEKSAHLKGRVEKKLSHIFDMRLAALRWIASEDSSSIDSWKSEAYSYFENLADNENLAELAQNILFALRCNNKIADSLIGTDAVPLKGRFPSHIPDISLDQFIASIMLSYPYERVGNLLIEWAKCSLRIEYVVLAAALLNDKQIGASSEVLHELSFIIIDAAQTYSAIAVETGMIPSKPKVKLISPATNEDADFLAEQRLLAEADINYFAKIWKE